ncbi:DMT family transporter [Roseateles koreensis]|uniref:DMT family transporter n=1 Tax=Roseateles koreensis TaxID=2987526 RepID=A0ABT5KQQ0_9BURK|nr:DMT family transporter [Roseateles koreensis]MDC8784206.1 DMT family transporter [Roseateles koreensis]
MPQHEISDSTKGILFATLAAALNGTIGVLSKFLMESGLTSASIAFFKSLIGFICLLIVIRGEVESTTAYLRAGVCAFFGIFILFYFETSAYHHELAANVVLTLMAFATISAFILSWIFIGDKPTPTRWLGLAICVIGLAVFLGVSRPTNLTGLIYASIAGLGYGAFSVIAKAMKLGSGLAVTRRLLLFGSIYLAFPFVSNGAISPDWSIGAWTALLTLALLPSIGGFYCTTRAIELATPAQIQLFELTEPLFAALLAVLFLNEFPGLNTYLGGALVVIGLFVSQQNFGKKYCH